MSCGRVIVRADQGEPLARELIECGNGLAYVAHPELVNEVSAGNSDAVGFPLQDVFEMDQAGFESLTAEWAAHGSTNRTTWSLLKRLEQGG